jgi:hypothetical protein
MKLITSLSKRRYLAIISVLLIIAALIALAAGCEGEGEGDGDGSTHPSEDLEIWTWYDLDDVRYNSEGHHTLMNDLDSTTAGYTQLASPTANEGKGWEPIGVQGSFDGQGYEIRDMYIYRPDESKVALFGGLNPGRVIQNVGVVDADVTGDNGVAGLVAFNNEGTLRNSYFTGSLNGEMGVGGLVAFNNEGIISNSHYNYDETLINGENIITIGALSNEDFDEWLANDKFLDVNERLSQEDGYYLVNNITDFKQLLAFGQDDSLKFRLKNDLDLAADPNFHIPYLAGEFDGNSHEISNLSFSFAFVSNVGLFGYLAPGGRVTDLAVQNVNIIGTSFVGGLVGANWEGTVSNCHSTGTVTGTATRLSYAYEESVGGLVGANWGGTVSDSYSIGSVSGKESVGGLVGFNYEGDVSNSHFTGNVVGIERVGGLVGGNILGSVSNSCAAGSLIGRDSFGGLVGMLMASTVSNSYSTCTVTGYATESDGMIGWRAGGLIGANHAGTVSDSYSTGSVIGVEYVGGLVGRNFNYATVSNSYSTGSVTGDEFTGGMVGMNEGTVSNCFWDTETSGQDTSDGGIGENTAEMQQVTTFSVAGWNITAVDNPSTRNPSYAWNIVDAVTYPFLNWEP